MCSVCIKLQTTCRVSAAPDPKSRSHEALNHQTVYFPTSMCLWFCATCIFTHPHLFKRIDKLLCVACPCWTQESSMYAFSYMSSMSAICQFSFSFQLRSSLLSSGMVLQGCINNRNDNTCIDMWLCSRHIMSCVR